MVSMIMLCVFTVYGGIEVLGRIAQLFLPFYGPLIQTIIPLFLLMVAMVRKKIQKQTESSNMNN